MSFSNSSKKIEEVVTFPNSFYKARTTLIPKPYKDITRKVQASIACEYKYKNLQQNIRKSNPAEY